MRKEIVVLWVASMLASGAGERSGAVDVSSARLSALEQELAHGREALAANLAQAQPTPEERALIIESWLTEELRIEQQLRAARAASPPRSGTAEKQIEVPATPDPETQPASEMNPLAAEIHEIETDIRKFRDSLATDRLTPEQRAIQIEEFHRLTRRSPTELRVFSELTCQVFLLACSTMLLGEAIHARSTEPPNAIWDGLEKNDEEVIGETILNYYSGDEMALHALECCAREGVLAWLANDVFNGIQDARYGKIRLASVCGRRLSS